MNALGYAHPEIVGLLRGELESLLHVSNLIYHGYQAPLAEKLAKHTGLDRVFFRQHRDGSNRGRDQAGARLRPEAPPCGTL